MLGVLAFGDSITNGGGELQWGVALQSWALWLARAYGLPYSSYAVDGTSASGVAGTHIPEFLARHRDGRFDLGCLYIGANDVRGYLFDEGEFARCHREALDFLHERCDRVLTCTLPADLGRPRARFVGPGNAAILRNAAATGAVVCDLRDFGARNHVMADRVHPTAFGQVAIAERAIRALGTPPVVWPSQLLSYETTGRLRLRGDATYAYRVAKEYARAAWLRARSG